MSEEILNRTKALGIMIIHLIAKLPNNPVGWVISKQVVRSATSVGANYRASRRAKSKPDFINKLKIVEEECDETIYWLEVIEDASILEKKHIDSIKKEASELLAIFVASLKTLRTQTN